MELDEFKTYWNTIQDREFTQQKLTKEKLDEIVMETADTLDYLQKKSTYWIRVNKSNTKMLKGMLIPFSLIILVKAASMASKTNSIGASLTYAGTSLAYIAIILLHYFVTTWAFERQRQIFTINDSENLQETLTRTVTGYKRFYLQFNIVYLFLYPFYFYSIIKLITYWTPSTNIILLTCALLTILSLALGHLLYKLKYSSKIKLLEAHLKELEEDV
jgi:hypothetical protein